MSSLDSSTSADLVSPTTLFHHYPLLVARNGNVSDPSVCHRPTVPAAIYQEVLGPTTILTLSLSASRTLEFYVYFFDPTAPKYNNLEYSHLRPLPSVATPEPTLLHDERPATWKQMSVATPVSTYLDGIEMKKLPQNLTIPYLIGEMPSN